MGIRTPVVGVKVLHDWPVYTIAVAFDPPAQGTGGTERAGADSIYSPNYPLT